MTFQYPLDWLPNLEANSHISWKLWGGLGIGVGTMLLIKAFKQIQPLHNNCIDMTINLLAGSDHVWRTSDYDDGVKDNADDSVVGLRCRHLLELCPHALHPDGHPNVNNPMPGHFFSADKKSDHVRLRFVWIVECLRNVLGDGLGWGGHCQGVGG